MRTSFQTIAILISLVLFSLPAQSRELPDYYPDRIAGWFTIDDINLSRLKIIINDFPLDLSPNAKVHSPNTEFSSLQVLKPGMKIFFSRPSNRTINEIWILPEGYRHHVQKR